MKKIIISVPLVLFMVALVVLAQTGAELRSNEVYHEEVVVFGPNAWVNCTSRVFGNPDPVMDWVVEIGNLQMSLLVSVLSSNNSYSMPQVVEGGNITLHFAGQADLVVVLHLESADGQTPFDLTVRTYSLHSEFERSRYDFVAALFLLGLVVLILISLWVPPYDSIRVVPNGQTRFYLACISVSLWLAYGIYMISSL